jgi:serine/threonine-protein kinase
MERRAAQLGATADQLCRYYRGDLDNILAKALEKDPKRRYAGATSFRDDLLRFTRHEPVSAHRDSWRYRAGKFVRRHRAGTLTAALIALLLIGSTVFSYRQMLIAQRQRDRADQALRRSDATTSFETLLFRLLEPGGQPLTYEQLLERGRHALEREYRGDPISRMQLGIQFAVNYLRSGRPGTADTIIRGTVAIADSLADAEWQGRTRCELAIAQAEGGAADSALEQIADGRRFLASARDVERGTANACDKAEGEALMRKRRFDEAAIKFGAIVDRLRDNGDTTTGSYLNALNDQSRAFFNGGRIRETHRNMRRLLDLTLAGGSSDPQTALVLAFNLHTTYVALGEFVASRDFLGREIARVMSDTLALRHPMLIIEYALLFELLEEYDSASFWFDRAFERNLDNGRAYSAHLALARIARRAGRVPDVKHHESEADRLLPAGPVPLGLGVAKAITRIEAAMATGDRSALAAEVDAQMQALDYSEESGAVILMRPLLAAAAALIEAGQPGSAERFVEHALRIASVDSLTTRHSGFVGHGLLLQARVALARGDTAQARERVTAALPALASGFGTGHSLHTSAAQLREALARR